MVIWVVVGRCATFASPAPGRTRIGRDTRAQHAEAACLAAAHATPRMHAAHARRTQAAGGGLGGAGWEMGRDVARAAAVERERGGMGAGAVGWGWGQSPKTFF